MRRPFKRWEREWVERDRALRKNVLYRSLLTACGTTYCFRDYLFLAGQSQKISCRIDLLSSGTLIFPLSKTKFISCCVCPVYPYCPGFCALEYPDSSCSCPILFLGDYSFLSILSWFLPCVILTVFVPALSNSYCPIFYPNSDYPSYVPCPFLSIMSWILSCLIQTTAFPNVTYSDYPASCPVFSILSWLLPGHIHSSLIPSLSYPCWFLPILFRLRRFLPCLFHTTRSYPFLPDSYPVLSLLSWFLLFFLIYAVLIPTYSIQLRRFLPCLFHTTRSYPFLPYSYPVLSLLSWFLLFFLIYAVLIPTYSIQTTPVLPCLIETFPVPTKSYSDCLGSWSQSHSGSPAPNLSYSDYLSSHEVTTKSRAKRRKEELT